MEHEKISKWLKDNCYGVKNAKVRKDILPFVAHFLDCPDNILAQDRRLRRIISDLKHQGLVGATCNDGYWFINLDNLEDIEAAEKSYKEMKSKALDMLTGCDVQLKRLDDRKQQVAHGQMTFPNKVGV